MGLNKVFERIMDLIQNGIAGNTDNVSCLLMEKGKTCEYHSATLSGTKLSVTLLFPVPSSGFKPLADNSFYAELLWRGHYLTRLVPVKVEVSRTSSPGTLKVVLSLSIPKDKTEAALKVATILKTAESVLEEGRVPMGIIGM